MILRTYIFLFLLLPLAACSIEGSEDRIFDPDEVFSALDAPDVPRIHQTLHSAAKDATKRGEYGKAVSLYQQLVDKERNNLDYLLGLAEALRRGGEHVKAIKVYHHMLTIEPDNLNALEGKGLATMALGEFSDAGKLFEQVVHTDPTRWRTLNALGILFSLKGHTEDGMAYYREALKQDENNPTVLNNIGLSWAVGRNFRKSIAALTRGIHFSDTKERQKQIELNLALVHGISGDMETASKIASKHLEGPALDNNLGLYAHLANNDELAKSYLNTALTHSSTFYERAWRNLDIISQTAESEFDRTRSREMLEESLFE